MIRTIADTIIWYAQEIQKGPRKCQDENAAINAVLLEVKQLLMNRMAWNCRTENMKAGYGRIITQFFEEKGEMNAKSRSRENSRAQRQAQANRHYPEGTQ